MSGELVGREHVEAALWKLLGASGVETTTKTPQRIEAVLAVVDEYVSHQVLEASTPVDLNAEYFHLWPGRRDGDVARCKKCLEVKRVSEFYRKSDRKEGIATACKRCHLVMYEARRERRSRALVA